MSQQPQPPYEPPSGYTWHAEIDPDATVLNIHQSEGRRCAWGVDQVAHAVGLGKGQLGGFTTRPHNPCNGRPDILINRSEPRCGNHLDGRWVRYGVVWQWQLSTGEVAA